MASVDSCSITSTIAPGGAPQLMWWVCVAHPTLSSRVSVGLPNSNGMNRVPVEQISPDENVNPAVGGTTQLQHLLRRRALHVQHWRDYPDDHEVA